MSKTKGMCVKTPANLDATHSAGIMDGYRITE
jgi:hypothetical protein